MVVQLQDHFYIVYHIWIFNFVEYKLQRARRIVCEYLLYFIFFYKDEKERQRSFSLHFRKRRVGSLFIIRPYFVINFFFIHGLKTSRKKTRTGDCHLRQSLRNGKGEFSAEHGEKKFRFVTKTFFSCWRVETKDNRSFRFFFPTNGTNIIIRRRESISQKIYFPYSFHHGFDFHPIRQREWTSMHRHWAV